MADLTPTERLQPCLLDRLTDEHPELQRESRDERVVPMSQYRRAVLRDLNWLLNASTHPPGDEIYEYEDAAASVLNFGIRDFCGLSSAGLSPEQLERELIRAVKRFEPRVLEDSISITAVRSGKGVGEHSVVAFEIKGDLWAQPTPDPLYIRTEIDLETGRCEFASRKNG
jgi:type VI secretion system protein ImpF